MTDLEAIEIIEGDDTENQSVELHMRAWQSLVDSGTAFKLQGWYGRTAMELIREGYIHLPKG